MNTINEYTKQAQDFLKETNTTLEIKFNRYDYHFTGDKDKRDIYNITIKRNDREFTFKFGNSIVNSGVRVAFTKSNIKPFSDEICNNKDIRIKKHDNFMKLKWLDKKQMLGGCTVRDIIYPTQPTEYDILACLTKYNPESHENFCSECGYDIDSITALDTYNAVQEEYDNVCMIWNSEEVEQLAEIQ